MSVATGVGSWPGDDAESYTEAVRVVLGEAPDLPYLPELPGRGVPAGMTGRAIAMIADLGFDLLLEVLDARLVLIVLEAFLERRERIR